MEEEIKGICDQCGNYSFKCKIKEKGMLLCKECQEFMEEITW